MLMNKSRYWKGFINTGPVECHSLPLSAAEQKPQQLLGIVHECHLNMIVSHLTVTRRFSQAVSQTKVPLSLTPLRAE